MFIPNKESNLETKLPKVRSGTCQSQNSFTLATKLCFETELALLTVCGFRMSNIRTKLGKFRLDYLSVCVNTMQMQWS